MAAAPAPRETRQPRLSPVRTLPYRSVGAAARISGRSRLSAAPSSWATHARTARFLAAASRRSVVHDAQHGWPATVHPMLAEFAVASDPLGDGFTVANALATLLTTESLLFAAFGVAANFSTVGGRRLRKLLVPGEVLGGAAVLVLALVALGAVTAWSKVFLPEFPNAFDDIVIAVALLLAIIAQPVLALLLALGLRTQR